MGIPAYFATLSCLVIHFSDLLLHHNLFPTFRFERLCSFLYGFRTSLPQPIIKLYFTPTGEGGEDVAAKVLVATTMQGRQYR